MDFHSFYLHVPRTDYQLEFDESGETHKGQ